MNKDYEGRLFIDGQFCEAESGRRFEVLDPTDGSVVATASDAGLPDVAKAVEAARRVADEETWAQDHKFRQKCLRQWRTAMLNEVAAAGALQTAEAGTCTSAMGLMVDSQVDQMSWVIDLIERFDWESECGPFEMMGMQSGRRVRYEPYGVVGAITPWNAPFMSNVRKSSYALASGNTVILKTAPDTPLTGAWLAELALNHTDMPPGVFNVIGSADGAAVGDMLTADRRVDMFHFTGSTGVGQRIAERAATGIRKVSLELGGKSANIIFPDADLEMAAQMGIGFCMMVSGQGCSLPTRMVVHADVYDGVLERLEALAGQLPWGDPRDPTTVVGPIIRAEQVDRIDGLVQRAVTDGARILAGGKRGDRDGKGHWYVPTVVADVNENSELAQTEVFGPVLSVLKYDGDEDEAVRIANNSRYGLSSYIQTTDPEFGDPRCPPHEGGNRKRGRVDHHRAGRSVWWLWPERTWNRTGGGRLSGVPTGQDHKRSTAFINLTTATK